MSRHQTLSIADPARHVRLVTLNRPEVANAINTRMGQELLELFAGLSRLEHDCRCVVLTGAGRCFSAGGDLKERDGMVEESWRAQHLLFEKMIDALVDCPVPVIAAVNGPAYAGGLEIAACCDFIYASSNARFALTEVTLGFMPGSGGTQTLPRAVGKGRAKEILLTGRPFSAAQAFAWGLANRITKPSALLEEAVETAAAIAANAPLATRKIKHVVDLGMALDLRRARMVELEAYGQLIATEDRQEGVRAFNEKRSPVFTGR